jgi:uncharacterized protein YjbJ (UPF0337 family)
MDWNRVEGSWKQMTGKVKEQWGKLTDDEITRVNGNREQLEGLIQERYGKAKDDVRREVDDWYNGRRGEHFVDTARRQARALPHAYAERHD